MSTPSTASALQPPHQLFSHYSHYPSSRPSHRSNNLSLNGSSSRNYTSHDSSRDSRNPAMPPAKAKPSQASSAKQSQSSQQQPLKREKQPDWEKFFENGVPKEFIVIDDSPSPDDGGHSNKTTQSAAQARPADKKRKINGSSHYDPVHSSNTNTSQRPALHDDTTSNSAGSSARTASAFYSTAPTSLTSQSSSGNKAQKLDDSRAGQKRKRPTRQIADEESPEVEVVAQNKDWCRYIPPPNPPLKAGDVHVKVVHDVS